MYDCYYVGVLGEFQVENIIFCIRCCQFVNYIVGGQYQVVVFDDVYVIVVKFQCIGLYC